MIQPLKEKIARFSLLLNFRNRWQLIVNRLIWPNGPPVFYQFGELEFLVDHSAGDQDGARSCIVPGLYDSCLTSIPGLPKELVLLDLGANGGGFALALRKHGFAIRQAVMVELNPHTWSRAVFNVFRNIPGAHSTTRILNAAAGGEDGLLEIRLGRGSVSDSVKGSSEGDLLRIPMHSFSSLLTHFPEGTEIDICKIDIEGAEYDLFGRIRPAEILRCRWIIIELHEIPGSSPEDVRQRILDFGFAEFTPREKPIEDNVFIFSRTSL